MNNLQELKVIEVSKPTIEFNYQAVKAQIDQLTEQYRGLTIQEPDLPFTKDLLAYLNKLKKSVDDFRKETKKEISKPIATFEDQCKELVGSIDNVYADIKKQYDDFEDRRREERAKAVDELVAFARAESGLPDNYKGQIQMKSEYLNKTMTDNKIMKDLDEIIAMLSKEWELEKAKNAQIDMICELMTSNFELSIALDPAIYYHLDLETAREQIFNAGERQKAKQDEAIAKIAEQARIEAEQKANAEVEQKAQELAKKQVEEAQREIEQAHVETQQAKEETQQAYDTVATLAEQVADIIPEEDDDVYRERVLISMNVTEGQKRALLAYLKQIDVSYEIYN